MFLSESGCKGTTIFWITKLFIDFFAKKQKVFDFHDKSRKPYTLLYNILLKNLSHVFF